MRGGITMKKRLTVVAAVALSALLFSGCFTFQSLSFDPAVVKAGKKTAAVVKLVPDLSQARNKMIPFILVGLSDSGVLEVTDKRTFDTKGDYGGPEHMITDANLRNVAIEDEDCTFGGQTLNQIQGVSWTAARTEKEVSDRDKFKAPAVAKLTLKVVKGLDRTQGQVYVLAGNWSDQGQFAGVVEEPEVACAGGSISTLTLGG
jgi:hypothetical protein